MRAKYQYEIPGHNYRLTDLQAALALPQLDRYDGVVGVRRANAAELSAGLAGIPGLRVPVALPGRSHVWHQYTVVVEDGAAVSRDELAARLTERGVGCGVYYPRLVYDYDCYRDHPRVVPADVPVASRVAAGALSLPVHQYLSEADLDGIVTAVRDAMGA
jgi:perosamine synthetase